MGMPVNCGVSAVRVQGKRVVTLRLQRDWLCLGWLVMDAEVVEVTKTDFRYFWPAAVAVRGLAAGSLLPLHEALYSDPATGARHGLLLVYPHGLCGSGQRLAAGGLAGIPRQSAVDHRLRHPVRHGGQG